MTVANRAIGAPINIWNDHSDAMSQRDSGWLQLYAETNQEALDLHIQAFKLAEELSMPVMVCMDGFILTHAVERVDVPEQAEVDAFLPPYAPRQVLDPDEPVSIGAMVGPEAFMEVRYLAHAKQLSALEHIPRIAAEFGARFGRDSGGLVRGYRCDDAETIVVALGSVIGTLKETVDALRDDGMRVGVSASSRIGHSRSQRSAPRCRGRVASSSSRRASASASAVSSRPTFASRSRPAPARIHVVAGLGGRAITRASLERMLGDAAADRLEPLTFLDLDRRIVDRQLEREARTRRSGPIAENLLRDVGTVAAKVA
jgi:pyruvate ferredoxin oxidoreductase alpha subunit